MNQNEYKSAKKITGKVKSWRIQSQKKLKIWKLKKKVKNIQGKQEKFWNWK